MQNIRTALAFGLALAACHHSGPSASGVQSMAAAGASSAIRSYGPYDTKFDVLTLTQKDGKAFKVEIDHRTVKSCWAPYRLASKEVAKGEYMVEFEPLIHPAIVCAPDKQKDMELGVVINVPATAPYSHVRIHVKRFGATPAPVVVTADDNADVEQSSVEETYQNYSFSQSEGKAFTIKVDRQTIKGCYARLGYSANEYADQRYFVNIQSLMVPAVACTPSMMRDLEMGAEIKVPSNNKGYSQATLYVTPVPGGSKAKVEVSLAP